MIYLDNAATSFPKPESVYRAVDNVLRKSGGNAGRGSHGLASGASQSIKETRARIAGFLGIKDPMRLLFAFNATDALNMAIKGYLAEGDHVVTSDIEHNSVLRPLSGLEEQGIITVTRVSVSTEGFIDPLDLRKAICSATKLVVVTHASNVLGTIQPVADFVDICAKKGVALLLDAAQSVGEIPIDVESLGVDMMAFPGHKALLGPQGTGGLYVRDGIELSNWREGGTGTESAMPTQPDNYPAKLEAGTQNLPGLIGMGEGVKYLESRGIKEIHEHCMNLIQRVIDALLSDSRFTVYGSTDLTRHVHALSLSINGMDPAEAGLVLDQTFGIAVRTGLHCAAPIHKIIGTYPSGTIRVSPGPFSTTDDIDAFINALYAIAG
ncbi:MAG: aminotransferase class V-fold PLP-dependent enzyme [Kiritimatiellae bacterium]|nr:aminotransferase class V-fold PLP-dependent enzyme [Kiritimatiellia bacterium]